MLSLYIKLIKIYVCTCVNGWHLFELRNPSTDRRVKLRVASYRQYPRCRRDFTVLVTVVNIMVLQ
jgi:hypothetical protein